VNDRVSSSRWEIRQGDCVKILAGLCSTDLRQGRAQDDQTSISTHASSLVPSEFDAGEGFPPATRRSKSSRNDPRRDASQDISAHSSDQGARLIFADPPYNIGVNYGDHYDDQQSEETFISWCAAWVEACHRSLTPDGSLWILAPHDLAASLWLSCARPVGLHLRQWIIWYESFGVNATRQFNDCSRTLLWLTKDPKVFVFNDHAPEIRRVSDRAAKYNDGRANLDGKLWDNVWGVNPAIPRLVGTAKERLPGFPTQLPVALLRPIVACASRPGDLVIDPFSGSGTTGVASLELGRRYLGIELSAKFAELSRRRLSGVSSNDEVSVAARK
jgi:site-specific DNA-methyltransferase (adenine-specific)